MLSLSNEIKHNRNRVSTTCFRQVPLRLHAAQCGGVTAAGSAGKARRAGTTSDLGEQRRDGRQAEGSSPVALQHGGAERWQPCPWPQRPCSGTW